MGVLTCFTPPYFVWPCLLCPRSVSGCIHCGVHYPPVSMGIDTIPSTLHRCSFWGLQPHHITWGLNPSSVDTRVDIHGRSCNFPFIHPREAFTGRLLADHLTIILLWCPLCFISYRGSLAWGWAGTPVLCMTVAHTPGNANLWCNEKKSVSVEDVWLSLLVHHFVRGDICHDWSWSDAPPPKYLLPTYPWFSSFP